MVLFNRTGDKGGLRTESKQHLDFRNAFRKFTGAKLTRPTPEPITTSVPNQSNASERPPRNSTVNSTSASLQASRTASKSVTTTPPCHQAQMADGESFLSRPDAKKADPHLDETDISSSKQGPGDELVKVALSNDFPYQDITSTHKTLRDRAYNALRSSNDPSKLG